MTAVITQVRRGNCIDRMMTSRTQPVPPHGIREGELQQSVDQPEFERTLSGIIFFGRQTVHAELQSGIGDGVVARFLVMRGWGSSGQTAGMCVSALFRRLTWVRGPERGWPPRVVHQVGELQFGEPSVMPVPRAIRRACRTRY